MLAAQMSTAIIMNSVQNLDNHDISQNPHKSSILTNDWLTYIDISNRYLSINRKAKLKQPDVYLLIVISLCGLDITCLALTMIIISLISKTVI